MPPGRGKDFLLKIGDGATSEVFTTIAGLRATALSINGATVDVTTKDQFIGNTLWQALLDGGGIRALQLTADGIYEHAASQHSLRDLSLSGALTNFQLDDGQRTWEGAFQLSNYQQSGPHDNAQTFSVTLDSSGQIAIATSS